MNMMGNFYFKKSILTCLNYLRKNFRSDSGASPDEAVSWGKIKRDATPVKVCIYKFFTTKVFYFIITDFLFLKLDFF